MPLTTYTKNEMLNVLPTLYVSAHTDDPTEAGLREVDEAGYSRVAVTLDAANNGARPSPAPITINIPAGNEITYLGYWDALTGGNFRGYDSIPKEVFTNTGELEVNSINFDLNLN